MPDSYTIREHERFRVGDGLDRRDLDDLKAFARHLADVPGEHRRLPVLEFDGRGGLRTGNHVGVITTKRGTVVEILPKIHLGRGTHAASETTRETFLGMLRVYRGLKRPANLPRRPPPGGAARPARGGAGGAHGGGPRGGGGGRPAPTPRA
ncbi:MAG: hypothetical protein OXU64_01510, partial [Gemmatimonadota bacterium]|nr:hypothetical protein [Gemmatimonadota bacterium]